MFMIAVCLLPIYLIYNLYLCYVLIKWLDLIKKKYINNKIVKVVLCILILVCTLSPIIPLIIKNRIAKRIFFNIGYWYFGFLLYFTCCYLVELLVKWLLKKKLNDNYKNGYSFILGSFVIAVSLLICALGFINARDIKSTTYDVKINKKTSINDLKIAFVADYHLGYNMGYKIVEKTVEKINKEKPDIVLIGGDIFDNNYDSLDDPEKIIKAFRKIESKYGVFAVYGNHDIDEKIFMGFTFSSKNKKESDVRMDELLTKSNIILLKDEYVLIDNAFYLVGRPDIDRPNRGVEKRINPENLTTYLNQDLPIIVLEHEPVELLKLSKNHVDLDLNGHTHDGQIFPLNYLIKLKFDNTYGLKKYNNMYDIVTSGVGVFGVNMRILTSPEVVTINVKFNNEK